MLRTTFAVALLAAGSAHAHVTLDQPDAFAGATTKLTFNITHGCAGSPTLAVTAYLPPGTEPGLEATHAFDPPALTFSSGTHICQVEIDRDSGRLTIARYLIVEDCGTMLNPKVVEGQLLGATVQGLGGALFEEIVYDADGQNLSGTFLDYALPTASRLPTFAVEHLERPDPKTPLGMKGMAEGGTMGASAFRSSQLL